MTFQPLPKNAAWYATVLSSIDARTLSPLGDVMPGFPPTELQAGTVGHSGARAIEPAFAFYEDVAQACGPIMRGWHIIDFGSCWGRVSRMFLDKVPARNIIGIDVEPKFVELARSLFSDAHFAVCKPLPPTTLPAQTFDLAVAYSVFSHLSTEAALAWVDEFARILKPGGFLAFTTRHDSFFDYIEALARDPAATGYARALATMFPDVRSARQDYRNGRFVFANSAGVAGGGSMDASYYGEAFIPPAYVEKTYTTAFDVVAAKFDGSRYDQMLYVLRKKIAVRKN